MYVSRKASDEINLDIEYSPSRNTKRFQEYANPNEKVVEHFLEVIQTETDRVRSKYQTRLNVRYGHKDGKDNRLLDIYYKGVEKDSPIFVFIHGGYWQVMDKNTAGFFVAPLVERGYRVVVVDYNLCPTVTLEELIEQTLEMFEWLFQYAEQTNASRITFSGHSAGAHLASLLFYSDRFPERNSAVKIGPFFLISGVYDFRELYRLDCVNPQNILSLNLESATKLSPICCDFTHDKVEFYKTKNIRIHILVGENDSQTFVEQSRAFFEKLKSGGFNVELQIFEKYDHFDIVEEAFIEDSEICGYITKNL